MIAATGYPIKAWKNTADKIVLDFRESENINLKW
jgi:hypothetical protein